MDYFKAHESSEFNKIRFCTKSEFPYTLRSCSTRLTFEIHNSDIRPEFEAIKEYFSKSMKKKLIDADVKIQYNEKEIIKIEASSDDIDKINHTLIDNVRFHFIKRNIFHHQKSRKYPVIISYSIETNKQCKTFLNLTLI